MKVAVILEKWLILQRDKAKWHEANETIFFHFVNNKDIASVAQPDMSYLSETDVEMLDKYINQLKDKDFNSVSEASHGYARSHTAQNGVISVRDRLTEMGDTDEYIKYIEEQMRAEEAVA